VIPIALLSGDWYINQLRQQHPDLTVPFNNSREVNLKMLVDSNPTRKFYTVGLLEYADRSLAETYEPYQHGLLSLVQAKSWFSIDRLVKENEPLLQRYRPPAPDKIKRGTFERDILDLYAQPAARFGAAYERLGEKAEARRWYERALAIDPYLSNAGKGLERVR
jgi:tetratricopeptide (TPR) repeat protein